MEASKTSRFGRKAMSLFLSGAMVVAFAPQVAAPVAEAKVKADDTVNVVFDSGTGKPVSGAFDNGQATVQADGGDFYIDLGTKSKDLGMRVGSGVGAYAQGDYQFAGWWYDANGNKKKDRGEVFDTAENTVKVGITDAELAAGGTVRLVAQYNLPEVTLGDTATVGGSTVNTLTKSGVTLPQTAEAAKGSIFQVEFGNLVATHVYQLVVTKTVGGEESSLYQTTPAAAGKTSLDFVLTWDDGASAGNADTSTLSTRRWGKGTYEFKLVDTTDTTANTSKKFTVDEITLNAKNGVFGTTNKTESYLVADGITYGGLLAQANAAATNKANSFAGITNPTSEKEGGFLGYALNGNDLFLKGAKGDVIAENAAAKEAATGYEAALNNESAAKSGVGSALGGVDGALNALVNGTSGFTKLDETAVKAKQDALAEELAKSAAKAAADAYTTAGGANSDTANPSEFLAAAAEVTDDDFKRLYEAYGEAVKNGSGVDDALNALVNGTSGFGKLDEATVKAKQDALAEELAKSAAKAAADAYTTAKDADSDTADPSEFLAAAAEVTDDTFKELYKAYGKAVDDASEATGGLEKASGATKAALEAFLAAAADAADLANELSAYNKASGEEAKNEALAALVSAAGALETELSADQWVLADSSLASTKVNGDVSLDAVYDVARVSSFTFAELHNNDDKDAGDSRYVLTPKVQSVYKEADKDKVAQYTVTVSGPNSFRQTFRFTAAEMAAAIEEGNTGDKVLTIPVVIGSKRIADDYTFNTAAGSGTYTYTVGVTYTESAKTASGSTLQDWTRSGSVDVVGVTFDTGAQGWFEEKTETDDAVTKKTWYLTKGSASAYDYKDDIEEAYPKGPQTTDAASKIKSNYKFAYWSTDGTKAGELKSTSPKLAQDTTVQAVYEQYIAEVPTVSFAANPDGTYSVTATDATAGAVVQYATSAGGQFRNVPSDLAVDPKKVPTLVFQAILSENGTVTESDKVSYTSGWYNETTASTIIQEDYKATVEKSALGGTDKFTGKKFADSEGAKAAVEAGVAALQAKGYLTADEWTKAVNAQIAADVATVAGQVKEEIASMVTTPKTLDDRTYTLGQNTAEALYRDIDKAVQTFSEAAANSSAQKDANGKDDPQLVGAAPLKALSDTLVNSMETAFSASEKKIAPPVVKASVQGDGSYIVEITSTTATATLTYSLNGADYAAYDKTAKLTVTELGKYTVTAIATTADGSEVSEPSEAVEFTVGEEQMGTANALIDALEAADAVTDANLDEVKDKVEAIDAEVAKLDEKLQAAFSTARTEKLEAVKAKVASLEQARADAAAAVDVIALIDAIDAAEGTEAKTEAALAAQTAFEKLTEAQQEKVPSSKVAALYRTIAALASQANQDAAGAKAAEEAIAAIAAADGAQEAEDAIAEAREAYDALTDDGKALVSADAVKALTDAEAAKEASDAAAVKAAADTVDAYEAAVADGSGKTDEEKAAALEAAKASIDALTDGQAAQLDAADAAGVGAVKTEAAKQALAAYAAATAADSEATDEEKAALLEAAEEALADLTDAQRAALDAEQVKAVEDDAAAKAETDQKAADDAAAKIAALTDASSAEDVAAAKAAYDALTDDQKELVDAAAAAKLVNAAAAIDAAEAQKAIDAYKAAEADETKTAEEKAAALKAAEDAVSGLSAAAKAQVSEADLKLVTDAAARRDAAIDAADKAAADAAADKIAALTDASSSEDVAAAVKAYEDLTAEQKAKVPAATVAKAYQAQAAQATKAAEAAADQAAQAAKEAGEASEQAKQAAVDLANAKAAADDAQRDAETFLANMKAAVKASKPDATVKAGKKKLTVKVTKGALEKLGTTTYKYRVKKGTKAGGKWKTIKAGKKVTVKKLKKGKKYTVQVKATVDGTASKALKKTVKVK